MVRPTEYDVEYLTPNQLDSLRCPECRGMLVAPLTTSAGYVCPTAGHTGLMRAIDVQERFIMATPKAIGMHDPARVGHMWNYARKRMEEHWQDPAQLARARAAAKARKGKKP